MQAVNIKGDESQDSYLEMIKLVLELGADINLENFKGYTALSLAIENQQHKVVELKLNFFLICIYKLKNLLMNTFAKRRYYRQASSFFRCSQS